MANPRHRKSRRATGRHYHILDAKGLAAIIDAAIRQRFSGSRNAAAHTIGIPNSTLKRYHDGIGVAIRHETLNKVRLLIGAANLEALSRAVLSEAATRSLAKYDAWLEEEHRATLFGAVYHSRALNAENDWPTENANAAGWSRAGTLDDLFSVWDRRHPEDCLPLRKLLVQHRHSAKRARLAFHAIVAPLFHHDASGYIERSWGELDEHELRQFIRAGVKQQCILLGRTHDPERAQQFILRHRSDDPERAQKYSEADDLLRAGLARAAQLRTQRPPIGGP